jgi:ubiquinone/menaquinone biosynthesis C-methylase UbiE
MLGKDQYATSRNYDARIFLNTKYLTNRESKSKWILEFFPKKDGLKVLELGCGTGLFWLANRGDIPRSWEITLSDYSEGMLKETREAMSGVAGHFEYAVVDAQDIGYPDASFDLVLANNMLYHLADKQTAFRHIKRILRADGVFIASTQSRNDMTELDELYLSYMKSRGRNPAFKERSFSLDNGFMQLEPFFSRIEVERRENSLRITEAEPIIAYYRSLNGMEDGKAVLPEELEEGFRAFLAERLEEGKAIRVTKEAGLFVCKI